LSERFSNLAWPAPAKLNLFLHITGQRSNGYHELQTVFQLIDFCDVLHFELLTDSTLIRFSSLKQQSEIDHHDNLCTQAAKLLQAHTQATEVCGVHIQLDKKIPIGAGLGGGSSDAATCLVALNYLWKLNISTEALAALGAQLGADVAVFVKGYSAWAEGIGERLQCLELSKSWYLVVYPNIHVSTQEIYSSPDLTRDQRPITIADFLAGSTTNVMASLVISQYPQVKRAMDFLSQYAEVKMSGSGSSLFMTFDSEQEALTLKSKLMAQRADISDINRSAMLKEWTVFLAEGLNQSPLLSQIDSLAVNY